MFVPPELTSSSIFSTETYIHNPSEILGAKGDFPITQGEEAPPQAAKQEQASSPIAASPSPVSQVASPQSLPSSTSLGASNWSSHTAKTVILEEFPPLPPPPLPSQMPKIPTLDIEAYYLASPIDILAELPPRTLLQELLGRALMGGIGRLYFEHKGQYGRILWSQSGILQSVLDKLPSPLFEGVILELKQLAQLSLEPLTDLQQIELERLHQGKRLLMRFRFMPGQQGEQATLQVLRGAALKFYEQQQLNRLGKDALSMAQQLQRKLDEIRTRQSGEGGADKSVDSLTELQAVLKNLNQQLQDLEGEEHQ